MSQTAFAAWLAGIATLTEPQRLVALGALSASVAEVPGRQVPPGNQSRPLPRSLFIRPENGAAPENLAAAAPPGGLRPACPCGRARRYEFKDYIWWPLTDTQCPDGAAQVATHQGMTQPIMIAAAASDSCQVSL
jgi:hypothetical protein